MKKFLIWAMAATLCTGAAFAGTLEANRFAIAPNATFAAGAPATTNNDDSCDIAVTPAATLLLPYFEIDIDSPAQDAVNTIFTLTNTSPYPQIAHITVWTDWSYPVLDFNIFLTGYDVQGVSLYDIISRGEIPPTSIDTAEGELSEPNDENPNFAPEASDECLDLPGPIGQPLLGAIQKALTTGFYSNSPLLLCGTAAANQVGGAHDNAIGYVTVDVANTCSQSLPIDEDYYANEILYDNVLIGDYQRINPLTTSGNYAGGESMVHIRAIPEGGPAGSNIQPAGAQAYSNLPYTFYDRYTPPTTPRIDRRQPLPSMFAARYISGGTGDFETNLTILREGVTGSDTEVPATAITNCALADRNSGMPYTEIVRFDEQENPTTLIPDCQVSPCFSTEGLLPETSNFDVETANVFPGDEDDTDDLGGWMYLNLSIPASFTGGANGNGYDSPGRPAGTTQNWVTTKMTAESRYGVDFDAAYIANGCTGNPGTAAAIGPEPCDLVGGDLFADMYPACNQTP